MPSDRNVSKNRASSRKPYSAMQNTQHQLPDSKARAHDLDVRITEQARLRALDLEDKQFANAQLTRSKVEISSLKTKANDVHHTLVETYELIDAKDTRLAAKQVELEKLESTIGELSTKPSMTDAGTQTSEETSSETATVDENAAAEQSAASAHESYQAPPDFDVKMANMPPQLFGESSLKVIDDPKDRKENIPEISKLLPHNRDYESEFLAMKSNFKKVRIAIHGCLGDKGYMQAMHLLLELDNKAEKDLRDLWDAKRSRRSKDPKRACKKEDNGNDAGQIKAMTSGHAETDAAAQPHDTHSQVSEGKEKGRAAEASSEYAGIREDGDAAPHTAVAPESPATDLREARQKPNAKATGSKPDPRAARVPPTRPSASKAKPKRSPTKPAPVCLLCVQRNSRTTNHSWSTCIYNPNGRNYQRPWDPKDAVTDPRVKASKDRGDRLPDLGYPGRGSKR